MCLYCPANAEKEKNISMRRIAYSCALCWLQNFTALLLPL